MWYIIAWLWYTIRLFLKGLSEVIAIFSLFIAVALSLLVTRIATIALMLTGLSIESARFQAHSAFTGSGFTTKESESVVNHPVRRQIIVILMLLGNVGIATVVATSALSLISTSQSEEWWWYGLAFCGGMLLLVAGAWSRWVETHLNSIIAWGLKKWTRLDVVDYISVLQLQNGYAVTEMTIASGDWLDGKSLIEAALAREGILVLGILNGDGSFVGTPKADDRMMAGDTLILYGLSGKIADLCHRRREYREEDSLPVE